MSHTPELETFSIPDPRRNVNVVAGADTTVWEESMNGGFMGFIDRVSVTRGDNSLGNDDTYVDFTIDGVLVERIRREITLNFPDQFTPPLVVRGKITFRAHNGDSESHQFEVICQGRLCRPKLT